MSAPDFGFWILGFGLARGVGHRNSEREAPASALPGRRLLARRVLTVPAANPKSKIQNPKSSPRAIVLPVVLVLIGMLAVIMAGFMFFVRAEISGVQAQRDAQQARLAAESGLEELITVLRASPDDPNAWFDNPERFRHALVWAEDYLRESDPVRKMGSRKEIVGLAVAPVAWRYSVVARNFDGPPQTIRFGVTPESGKLSLNAATDTELERLLLPLLFDLGLENATELVACLLDWRDEDADTRPGGAEDDYYINLQPGYHCKDARFDTLEELLLVKGWSAAALYGEDVNRNGLLDRNEDDGAESFPYYDNGNGIVDPGCAPFLTVWAREPRAGSPAGGQPPPEGEQKPPEGAEGEEPPAAEQLPPGTPPPEMSPAGDKPEEPPKEEKKRTRQQDKEGEPSEEESGEKPPTSGQPGAAGAPQGSSGQVQSREGLVNVNTAPLRVLQALDNMPPEIAEAIVTIRQEQSGDALKTPEWLVSSGAMDGGTYALMKDKLTTRALQMHVEVVGYGDHTKLAQRHEWIVEMRGSVAQVLYHRDLTALGLAWPLDNDEYLTVRP